MRAIAYNIQAEEKELLVKANANRFNLTLISTELNEKTISFSAGKEGIIISHTDPLHTSLLHQLNTLGVRKIIIRSSGIQNIDFETARLLGIHILTVDSQLEPLERAMQIIDLLSP